MSIKVFILICMIFMHIVDDYYLQGWLASAKQKEYWKKNYPEPLYKYDYIIALFMHSFSWSFMINLIPTLYLLSEGISYNVLFFIINLVIHMIIDDLKANKKVINLVIDQICHIIQIVTTWLIIFV